MYGLALIGAGRIGAMHGANAAAHPRLELRFIVDPDARAASALAARTGAKTARFEEVLSDRTIDGVIIASPTGEHLAHARACAAAGRAMFVEKPIDLDAKTARGAAGELAGARLLVGFNRRFDPHFRALAEKLAAGAVGMLETLHIISHDPAPPPAGFQATCGGMFKDMSIHDFDTARWLLGEAPVSVYAAGSRLIEGAVTEGDYDTAKIVLRTASGKLCMISNTRRSGYGYDQRIEAFGSAGMARADNPRISTLETWSEAGGASAPIPSFFIERYAQAYHAELDHFAEVIGGAKPAVGFAEGLAALELAEAAGESARTDAVVALT